MIFFTNPYSKLFGENIVAQTIHAKTCCNAIGENHLRYQFLSLCKTIWGVGVVGWGPPKQDWNALSSQISFQIFPAMCSQKIL